MRRTTYERHGESRTRLYKIWGCAKRRCLNRSFIAFQSYGGRGISICREWANSFPVFRDWAVSNGYESHLTLDRIDPDGNYEPSNCRWATRKQQCANRRKRKDGISSKYKGVSWQKRDQLWHANIGINGKKKHLGCFKDEADAARAYDAAASKHFGEFANLNLKAKARK